MTVTLEVVLAEVAKFGSRPAGTLAPSLAKSKTWRLQASWEAFKKVPRPRPRRALAAWLKEPDTMRDVILAPGRPGADVVRDVDRALGKRSKRWSRLPADVRRERAETVAVAVYSSALSAHAPSRATGIASERSQAAHEQTQGKVDAVASEVTAVASGVEQILQRLGAAPSGDRERLEHRLARLPSLHHDAVRRAWEDAPEPTWTMVTALTASERRPAEVVAEWAAARPAWLASAPPQVQGVAARLAAAYADPASAREMFLAAARAGAPRRQYLIARAAALFDPPDYGEALAVLSEVGTPEESTEPFVRGLHAVLSGDWPRARAELVAWNPDDPTEWSAWLVLKIRVAFLGRDSDVTDNSMFDEALDAARKALEGGWSNNAALQASTFLFNRAVRGGSATGITDLREALDLSVRARDDARRWRGDSRQAVALACKVALHSDNARRVVELGAEEATPEEAASSEVAMHVAIARLSLDQAVEEVDLRRLTPYGRAVIGALGARKSRQEEAPHWLAAVEAATDEPERVAALAGLAGSGEAAHPSLAELDVEFPQVAALIRARADLAAGDALAAIAKLRGKAAGSGPAALVLAEAYQRLGEIDNAVGTLRQAAADTSDPEYGLAALRVLWAAGRKDEIPAALADLLATAPQGWAGRPEALQMAAQLAADEGDLQRTISLLRASLAEDPRDVDARWALARSHAARGELAAASAALAEHPDRLEPGTVDRAHLWLELNKAALDPPALAEQALALLDRFPDSEQLAAHALAVLVTSGREEGDLPDELLARVRALHDDFFEKWPESEHFSRFTVDVDDPEAALAALAELVSVTPEVARARREFQARLARVELPLGALATAVGKGYAELLLRRGVLGALPAWHPDPAEHIVAKREAAAALGAAVLIDTSSAVSLGVLSAQTREALLAAFRRVEAVDDALVDAAATRDSLGMRSKGVLTYDDRLQRPRYEEIPEETAERLAQEAEALHAALTALPRVAAAPPAADEAEEGLRDHAPWLPACRTAAATGIALWCDDAAVRTFARALGATAFSTWALVEVLAERSDLSSETYDAALADLVMGGAAGGLPLAANTLLTIAEREDWRVGGAALSLAHPALWRDHQRANRLLAQVVPVVVQHRPDALAAWIHQVAIGIGYAYPEPEVARVVSVGMLAISVDSAGSRPEVVRHLVEATRLGLAFAATDPTVSPDPLKDTARLVFTSMSSSLDPALAAQYVRALFSGLAPEDQATVARAVLS